MERTRLRDLGVSFLPDGAFLLRAPSRGLGAKVPVHVVEVLSFCSSPRTREQVEARYGPVGCRFFDELCELGFLVDPAAASATPVIFENFASLDVHRRMLGDHARMRAYAAAIAAIVKPGMAVLDAGTGSGCLAGMAAAAGARVVHAVDNSDMIEVAREVLRTFGDRVRTVRADIATVELPEQVDVIVTETFGALAVAEGGLDDVRACAARNLAPGGRVIPEALSLHVAPVGDRGLLEDAVAPFAPFDGVDLGVLRRSALQRCMTAAIRPESLLHAGGRFVRVPLPAASGVAGSTRLEGVRGTAVGFAAWFTLHLGEGIELPTGPADPVTHWKQQFLPVEPFEVEGALELEVEVGAALEDRRGSEIRIRWTSDAGGGSSFHRAR